MVEGNTSKDEERFKPGKNKKDLNNANSKSIVLGILLVYITWIIGMLCIVLPEMKVKSSKMKVKSSISNKKDFGLELQNNKKNMYNNLLYEKLSVKNSTKDLSALDFLNEQFQESLESLRASISERDKVAAFKKKAFGENLFTNTGQEKNSTDLLNNLYAPSFGPISMRAKSS